VPVTVRVVRAVDGEETLDTTALGWSGRAAVRIADRRCRTSALLWIQQTRSDVDSGSMVPLPSLVRVLGGADCPSILISASDATVGGRT
jgi:hypothetical protein